MKISFLAISFELGCVTDTSVPTHFNPFAKPVKFSYSCSFFALVVVAAAEAAATVVVVVIVVVVAVAVMVAVAVVVVVVVVLVVIKVVAGDKRSPPSSSPGCYYACVACISPASVWTSTKNEWNAQNAIWSRASRPSNPRNVITCVLTICFVKPTHNTTFWPSIVVARTPLSLVIISSSIPTQYRTPCTNWIITKFSWG